MKQLIDSLRSGAWIETKYTSRMEKANGIRSAQERGLKPRAMIKNITKDRDSLRSGAWIVTF